MEVYSSEVAALRVFDKDQKKERLQEQMGVLRACQEHSYLGMPDPLSLLATVSTKNSHPITAMDRTLLH